ncbi:hypothetical protein ACFL3G_03005 [Planctomycetota bacterium]
MAKYKNASVDLIKEDILFETEESVQSNSEIEKQASEQAIFEPKIYIVSTSTTTEVNEILFQEDISQSADFIDTKLSKRYTITLEQAKNRAIKAIGRARKRKSLLLNEED